MRWYGYKLLSLFIYFTLLLSLSSVIYLQTPSTVFFNCVVVTLDDERRMIEDGAVVVVGDKIAEIGERKQVLAKYP